MQHAPKQNQIGEEQIRIYGHQIPGKFSACCLGYLSVFP
jgi:hypothetical protein